MKKSICLVALFISLISYAFAQKVKPTLTILNIDSKGLPMDPSQLGNLTRIEVDKLDTFDVTDRYDVMYLIDKNKLNITNCYGKMCLLEIGNTIKTNYMLSGSVELYGQTIIATFRLINVANGSVEKTSIEEYIDVPTELQQIIGCSIKRMFGKPVNDDLWNKLTKRNDYESALNNPTKNKVNLSGPRFGYAFMFGKEADVLSASNESGGYNTYPSAFQFGYQFEKQYLNEGNFQALVEFIPMITGVDHQLFIPSLTFLNGFRNNKRGWEIGIGPTFSILKRIDGGEVNGKFYTSDQLFTMGVKDYTKTSKLDNRGSLSLNSALIIAIGRTLKSGKLNIPVNIWASLPNSDGWRIGISLGYNGKK